MALAPISSLAHPGRLATQQNRTGLLDGIFATIEDRAARLRDFLDSHARFAKLPQPQPQPEEVEWNGFLPSLRRTVPFALIGTPPPRIACFDAAQMQQVLINLLKNAHEAGGPAEAVSLEVRDERAHSSICVTDGGPGMIETVLHSALLPFYSTKTDGTGLGLTLFREIIEAHGGRLSLNNRPQGGLQVQIWLPRTHQPPADYRSEPERR